MNQIKVLGAEVFPRITSEVCPRPILFAFTVIRQTNDQPPKQTDAVIVPNHIDNIDATNYTDVFTKNQYESAKYHHVACVKLAYIEDCVAFSSKLDVENYMVKMPWPTSLEDSMSDESDTMELDIIPEEATVVASTPSSSSSSPSSSPAIGDDDDTQEEEEDEVVPATNADLQEFPTEPLFPEVISTNSQPSTSTQEVHIPVLTTEDANVVSATVAAAAASTSPRKHTSTVGDAVSQFLAIKRERLKLQKKGEYFFQHALIGWPAVSSCEHLEEVVDNNMVATTLSSDTTPATITTATLATMEPTRLLVPALDLTLPVKKRKTVYVQCDAASAATVQQEDNGRKLCRGSDDTLSAAAAIMALSPSSSPTKTAETSRRKHAPGLLSVPTPKTSPVKRKARSPKKPKQPRRSASDHVLLPTAQANGAFTSSAPFVPPRYPSPLHLGLNPCNA